MTKFNTGTISGNLVDLSQNYWPELRAMGQAYVVTVSDGDTATVYLTAEEVFEKAMDMLRAYNRMMANE